MTRENVYLARRDMATEQAPAEGESAGAVPDACPICGRAMVDGASVDRHHWVPRTEGGREVATLHKICHRMLHRLFSERDLAVTYNNPEAIAAHPDIQAFVAWVRRKPADFIDWPRAPRGSRNRRRPSRR